QLHFEFHKESCLEYPGIKISSSSAKSWGEPARTILFRFTSFLPSNFQGGHFRAKTPSRSSFASQKYWLAHCAFKMAATRRKVVSLGHAIYLFACHQEFSVYACLDMADFIRERESRRDSPAREFLEFQFHLSSWAISSFHKESCLESPGIKISSSSTKSWGEPGAPYYSGSHLFFLPISRQGIFGAKPLLAARLPARNTGSLIVHSRWRSLEERSLAWDTRFTSLHVIKNFLFTPAWIWLTSLEKENPKGFIPQQENFGISAPSVCSW
ncbi:hypothetical protein CEXT_570301, partial [Caerostris extrusa]